MDKTTIAANEGNSRGMRPRTFAKHYGLGEHAVYEGIRRGDIPAVKVGQGFVVLVQEFERQRLNAPPESQPDKAKGFLRTV